MEKANLQDVAIDALIPYKNNPRKNDNAVKAVANSLKEFGLVKNSIIVDEDMVLLTGHTTLKAAKKLGWQTIPEVTKVSGLTDQQKKAYRILDNSTGSLAQWDSDMLMHEIVDLDINFSDFDFDLPQQCQKIQQEKAESSAAADTIPEDPKTKRGDIYIMGNHRLMCGDSTDASDINKLLQGDHAELLFTSPPYADAREYNGGNLDPYHLSSFINAYGPHCNYQAVNLGLIRRDNEIMEYWQPYIAAAHTAGLRLLAWNVWDKEKTGSVGQQCAMFPIRHEWIFVFGCAPKELNRTVEKQSKDHLGQVRTVTRRQKDGTLKRQIKRYSSDEYKPMESIISIPSEGGAIRKLHPAVFPVELPAEYIRAVTAPNDIVIEPFGGSGTTLIACELTGRKCRTMELSEAYCDVIVQRWETETGQKAVLQT